MIQSSSNKDGTTRRLKLQLQECRVREELQRRAEELQTQVDEANRRAEASTRRAEASDRRTEASDRRTEELQTQVDEANRRAEASNRRAEASYRRAEELQTQVQGAEDRVQDLQRSLDETALELRQFEDRLQANSIHCVVKKEEIELTGPQLGVEGWARVSVAKFRGIQVAVKRIHNQIILITSSNSSREK